MFFLELHVRHHPKNSDIPSMLQQVVNCTYIRVLESIRGKLNVPTNLHSKAITFHPNNPIFAGNINR